MLYDPDAHDPDSFQSGNAGTEPKYRSLLIVRFIYTFNCITR